MRTSNILPHRIKCSGTFVLAVVLPILFIFLSSPLVPRLLINKQADSSQLNWACKTYLHAIHLTKYYINSSSEVITKICIVLNKNHTDLIDHIINYSAPPIMFLSQVRTWKMHLYTLIQVGCVLFLYGVKLSPGALVYPLVIVLLLPFKWVLSKLVFTKEEMAAVSKAP